MGPGEAPTGERAKVPVGARRAEWDLGGSEWEVGQHRVGPASGTLPRPSRPRGGRLDPEWRPLRSGDEPPGQTPQAESPTRAPASNASTARQPRPLPRDLSEVVPGEMSPQKWQVVGHGRDDRGEVPTGPLLRAVDLPTSRPPCALVPAACCLLSPPPSFAGAGFTRADDAAGSTAAAPEPRRCAPVPFHTARSSAAPTVEPCVPACGRDAVAVRAAVPHVQRGRSRPEASLLPLAHRRRRSVRCGAHLLMQQGAVRATLCHSAPSSPVA